MLDASPPVWIRYLRSIGEDPENTSMEYRLVDKFGDNDRSNDALYDLVIRGVKRATTGSVWSCEYDHEPVMKSGDLSIVTNHDASEMCVIRTKRVSIKPFKDVTSDDARIEGEGDGSLEYWRQAHVEFFTHECLRIGKTFSEDMPVVFEEFECVYH